MRRFAVLALAAAMVAAMVSCSEESTAGRNGTITLYNAQHEDLIKGMVAGFEKETDIKVNLRSGADFQLANQIVQEGASSPADVFVTENSPAMSLVDSKALFAKVDEATLAQVPAQFIPSSRSWTGIAARSTVFVYNKGRVDSGRLPRSLMDLQDSSWQGKYGVAAAGADFQAIVSAILSSKGEPDTAKWLTGLKSNARVYPNNRAVLKAVNNGELDAGVIYHYYWFKDQAESGNDSKNTALHFFGGKDPGGFLSISGAGVLASSKQQDKAQQFVKYLTGPAGQQILADSKALEYPIASGIAPNKRLKPFTELDPPVIDPATLNGAKVVDLMRNAGLL